MPNVLCNIRCNINITYNQRTTYVRSNSSSALCCSCSVLWSRNSVSEMTSRQLFCQTQLAAALDRSRSHACGTVCIYVKDPELLQCTSRNAAGELRLHIMSEIVRITIIPHYTAGRSGLAVACLTAVHEVLGSNGAVGSCVYRTTTAIYSLGHGLCAPFLQCLGQLSLLPSVGR